ncbi:Uma2 family endonuclease [Virgisporangium aliadipatigenens]|nr:Uma2 family endonuclease [Virgisporangium aliadipatigenens]
MTESVEAPAPTWIRRPDERGFTVADLHALPDDGLRYELIDGSLAVSPSATGGHNLITRWIANAVEQVNPTEEWYVTTDVSTAINDRNEPRPDLVVARYVHVNTTPFPIKDTLLVAEIVSPTSVLRDTEVKRKLYARAGVPAYWIVTTDEDSGEIALAELRLKGKAYEYRTHYTTAVFATDHPWPLAIDLPGLSRRWAKTMRPHAADEPVAD